MVALWHLLAEKTLFICNWSYRQNLHFIIDKNGVAVKAVKL